uniref:Apple domain-containing protein n=1 Tax=Panagrolaimus sp. ES5 TaxID=591445 RepID=A0AC34F0Q5_9BILA
MNSTITSITEFQDYQFVPILMSECKIQCVHDTECANIEGFDDLHVCVHPTLLNKPLSTIVGVTENVLTKDSAPSLEHPSGAIIKFLIFIIILLGLMVLVMFAHGMWKRYSRRKERGRQILKNESTGLRLDLISSPSSRPVTTTSVETVEAQS